MAKCHYCHDRYKKPEQEELTLELGFNDFKKLIDSIKFTSAVDNRKSRPGDVAEYYNTTIDGKKERYLIYYLDDRMFSGKMKLTIVKTKDDEQSRE